MTAEEEIALDFKTYYQIKFGNHHVPLADQWDLSEQYKARHRELIQERDRLSVDKGPQTRRCVQCLSSFEYVSSGPGRPPNKCKECSGA